MFDNDIFEKYTLDELEEYGVLEGYNTPATRRQIGYIHGLTKKSNIDEDNLLKEFGYEYMININPSHPLHELSINQAKEIIDYLINNEEMNNMSNLRRF